MVSACAVAVTKCTCVTNGYGACHRHGVGCAVVAKAVDAGRHHDAATVGARVVGRGFVFGSGVVNGEVVAIVLEVEWITYLGAWGDGASSDWARRARTLLIFRCRS